MTIVPILVLIGHRDLGVSMLQVSYPRMTCIDRRSGQYQALSGVRR
jgi:hypothetical protein